MQTYWTKQYELLLKWKKKKQKQKKQEDVWNQSNEAIQIIKKINFY